MQIICILLQRDNHASTSTSSLNFYRPDALPKVQPKSKNLRQKQTRTQSAMMRQPSWSTIRTSMAEGGEQNRCWNICRTDSTVRGVSFSVTAMWPSVRIVLSRIIVDSLENTRPSYTPGSAEDTAMGSESLTFHLPGELT